MIIELSFSLLKPYLITSSLTILACCVLFLPLYVRRKKQLDALQAELSQNRIDIVQYQSCVQQLDFFKDAHNAEQHKNQQLQVDITSAKEQMQHFKTRSSELLQQYQQGQQQLKAVQTRFEQTHAKLAALESAIVEKEQSFVTQLKQIEDSKRILTKEFENLANRVLSEKGDAFKALNQESVQSLLKPMQAEMKGFREKVEAIHTEELKQRSELRTELVNLQKLNQDITHQAQSLTNALQGQKKVQGNWGELMLENVLDSAGLRLGIDYKREVNFNTHEGKLRPDVIVYLPQNRHIVVDAKTSLNAYTRFVNAQSDLDAQIALKQHALAISDRINELANKDYFKLPGLNSPDVVVLFVPIESAYVEALKFQPDLYQKAIERNILVATPTTLLTSLNIVKQLWRFEDQSKHTAELASRAERFYNKLNGFLASMQGVGKQLDKAKESYDKAFSQLYSGRGNLIKQAAEFRDLGVSVQKELPEDLTDLAHLELDFVPNPSQSQ